MLEDFSIYGIPGCAGLAVCNSIQTYCVTGIHLRQNSKDLCVFHIGSSSYRFYCIKVGGSVSLTSVSNILDSMPLALHAV